MEVCRDTHKDLYPRVISTLDYSSRDVETDSSMSIHGRKLTRIIVCLSYNPLPLRDLFLNACSLGSLLPEPEMDPMFGQLSFAV